MSKPIMKPGHAGDLVMILEVSLSALRLMRNGGPIDRDELKSHASVTREALDIWLGLLPVPEVPE